MRASWRRADRATGAPELDRHGVDWPREGGRPHWEAADMRVCIGWGVRHERSGAIGSRTLADPSIRAEWQSGCAPGPREAQRHLAERQAAGCAVLPGRSGPVAGRTDLVIRVTWARRAPPWPWCATRGRCRCPRCDAHAPRRSEGVAPHSRGFGALCGCRKGRRCGNSAVALL